MPTTMVLTANHQVLQKRMGEGLTSRKQKPHNNHYSQMLYLKMEKSKLAIKYHDLISEF